MNRCVWHRLWRQTCRHKPQSAKEDDAPITSSSTSLARLDMAAQGARRDAGLKVTLSRSHDNRTGDRQTPCGVDYRAPCEPNLLCTSITRRRGPPAATGETPVTCWLHHARTLGDCCINASLFATPFEGDGDGACKPAVDASAAAAAVSAAKCMARRTVTAFCKLTFNPEAPLLALLLVLLRRAAAGVAASRGCRSAGQHSFAVSSPSSSRKSRRMTPLSSSMILAASVSRSSWNFCCCRSCAAAASVAADCERRVSSQSCQLKPCAQAEAPHTHLLSRQKCGFKTLVLVQQLEAFRLEAEVLTFALRTQNSSAALLGGAQSHNVLCPVQGSAQLLRSGALKRGDTDSAS